MCVSEYPTANEFAVWSNPVCVDEVDTAKFANISVDLSNPSSVFTTNAKVAVSENPHVGTCMSEEVLRDYSVRQIVQLIGTQWNLGVQKDV